MPLVQKNNLKPFSSLSSSQQHRRVKRLNEENMSSPQSLEMELDEDKDEVDKSLRTNLGVLLLNQNVTYRFSVELLKVLNASDEVTARLPKDPRSLL